MKIVAWTVLAVVLFVIFAFLYYLLVGAVLFRIIFYRRNIASRVLHKDIEKRMKEYKIDLGWWEKVGLTKVTTTSFDGLKLAGTLISANSNKTVIIFHGFGGSHLEMQPYAKFFHEKNFNVLAVDMRAHGESEGVCVGYGWLDRKDVLSWVKFVNQKTPENKILLFGLSMGGTSVCMASGEKGLDNIVGIISDCAFDNADREIEYIMKKRKQYLKLIKMHAYSYTKRLYGFDVMQADAIKEVKNTQIPILFIHGQEDDFVPLENVNNLYNSTPKNLREKFVVPNAKHAASYAEMGVLYEKRIQEFIEKRTVLQR